MQYNQTTTDTCTRTITTPHYTEGRQSVHTVCGGRTVWELGDEDTRKDVDHCQGVCKHGSDDTGVVEYMVHEYTDEYVHTTAKEDKGS